MQVQTHSKTYLNRTPITPRLLAMQQGELIDVSDIPDLSPTRLQLPTAVTRRVWNRYIQTSQGLVSRFRLGDILRMISYSVRQSLAGRQVIFFRIPLRDEDEIQVPRTARLKAVYDYGDHAERVITIMLPEES